VAAYPKALQALIAELARLPGLGPKSAERLALYLVQGPTERMQALARALEQVAGGVRACSLCRGLADRDPCPICDDPRRDPRLLCVVEGPAELNAMEAAGGYRGRYYVLGGALSPAQGVGPQQLELEGLVRRVRSGGVREVILATNPTSEGEATAHLLAEVLAPLGVRVTRLGYGLPVGADLKYVDGLTLSRALESRRRLD